MDPSGIRRAFCRITHAHFSVTQISHRRLAFGGPKMQQNTVVRGALLVSAGLLSVAQACASVHASLIGGAPTLTAVNTATASWPGGPSYLSTPASGLSLSPV